MFIRQRATMQLIGEITDKNDLESVSDVALYQNLSFFQGIKWPPCLSPNLC